MKLSASLLAFFLALPLGAAAQIARHPATPEDSRPNAPRCPIPMS